MNMILLETAIKNGMTVNYKENAIRLVKNYLKTHLIEKDVNEDEIYITYMHLDLDNLIIHSMLGSYQTPKYMYWYTYSEQDNHKYLEVYLKDDAFSY